MSLKRILAVMRARSREYYRDYTSWAWNLLMPVLVIFGFAFIFSGEPSEMFKVAVLDNGVESEQVAQFRQTRHILFIDVGDLQASITKVQRHQLDMLIEPAATPRYWVNEFSDKGYLLERILNETGQSQPGAFVRETVSGRDVRYVDWVMPGVLSMNMMFACLWGVGWVVVRYRKNGVLRRLQATPLTSLEFLSAQVLARLILITLMTILVYMVAHAVVDFTMRGSYLALFLVFVSGAACLISMGLIVATRLRTEEVADGFLNLMSWPMMMLSGLWFSMEGTHPAAQFISQLLPLTHVVNAARRIMIDGAGLSAVLFEIGVLVGVTLVLLTLSARLFRWD
jgi:ABC-2 type transport system permease protein